MFVAQLLFLTEPYVIGKMIDGLIAHDYFWLYLFIGIAVFENFFVYRRMVFDTKVYTNIYNQIVFKYLERGKDLDPSTRIARTSMSYDIIDFLENHIHYYISAVLAVLGSFLFIFWRDPLTAFIVLSCIGPIVAIVYFFYQKIEQSTRLQNTQFEKRAQILTENLPERVQTFFQRRRKILILGSTLQGRNWTSLNSTKNLFLILGLVVLTQGNQTISQGEAVSMFSYINQFLASLLSIPIGVETFTRMRDVIGRIKE
jgi:ABC-type multidrug transport system fused ATPase/permease subunit